MNDFIQWIVMLASAGFAIRSWYVLRLYKGAIDKTWSTLNGVHSTYVDAFKAMGWKRTGNGSWKFTPKSKTEDAHDPDPFA